MKVPNPPENIAEIGPFTLIIKQNIKIVADYVENAPNYTARKMSSINLSRGFFKVITMKIPELPQRTQKT